MRSWTVKFLIIFVCAFCIAFCGVSAEQSQQAQSFNTALQKVLINTPDIEIPENFQSVAFKTLAKSEVLGGKSNQNEFHGVRALRDMFGEDKQKFEAIYIYLGNGAPVVVKANATWYINQSSNGKPRFRLYYRKTPVTEAMNENDLLFIAKTKDDKLFIIIANNKSSIKDKLFDSLLAGMSDSKCATPVPIQPKESWYQVFFTPGPDCQNNIISRLKTAKTIDIAVYSITCEKLVNAIIEAHNRGAKVRVITDGKQSVGQYSRVQELIDAGVPLRMNDETEHKIEHNKYAIFDGKEIETGSFNWTWYATNKNSENCMFFKQTNNEFSDRYEYLWKFYEPKPKQTCN